MKPKLCAAALIVALSTPAGATTCSLVVSGKSLWRGKCYVKVETDGSLHAEAHRTDQCHASGGPKKCTSDEVCAGPWLDIFDEGDGSLPSYWSIENACHGGDPVEHISKTGPGMWQGNAYEFTVK